MKNSVENIISRQDKSAERIPILEDKAEEL
jgi:hypothetical protein